MIEENSPGAGSMDDGNTPTQQEDALRGGQQQLELLLTRSFGMPSGSDVTGLTSGRTARGSAPLVDPLGGWSKRFSGGMETGGLGEPPTPLETVSEEAAEDTRSTLRSELSSGRRGDRGELRVGAAASPIQESAPGGNDLPGAWELSGFRCAIKHVTASSRSEYKKFAEEVELLRSLSDSRHIVEIYDAQFDSEKLELTICMELGVADFARWLQRHHVPGARARILNISPPQAIRFSEQMVAAMRTVHEQGIMHCDLKPQNLVVVELEGSIGEVIARQKALRDETNPGDEEESSAPADSRRQRESTAAFQTGYEITGDSDAETRLILKLCDFGVARRLQDLATHLTADAGWGTAKYMAPEMVPTIFGYNK